VAAWPAAARLFRDNAYDNEPRQVNHSRPQGRLGSLLYALTK